MCLNSCIISCMVKHGGATVQYYPHMNMSLRCLNNLFIFSILVVKMCYSSMVVSYMLYISDLISLFCLKGQDATEAFKSVKHSTSAQEKTDDYRIGIVLTPQPLQRTLFGYNMPRCVVCVCSVCVCTHVHSLAWPDHFFFHLSGKKRVLSGSNTHTCSQNPGCGRD